MCVCVYHAWALKWKYCVWYYIEIHPDFVILLLFSIFILLQLLLLLLLFISYLHSITHPNMFNNIQSMVYVLILWFNLLSPSIFAPSVRPPPLHFGLIRFFLVTRYWDSRCLVNKLAVFNAAVRHIIYIYYQMKTHRFLRAHLKFCKLI